MFEGFMLSWAKRTDKFHFVVSIAKSILRILAGFVLALGAYVSAGVLLILAEVLGIIEEL